MASVISNLGGGWNGHTELTLTPEKYMAQTGYKFVTPHNPGNYSPTMGTSQEKALGTEMFRQNQALLRIYNTVDEALKK